MQLRFAQQMKKGALDMLVLKLLQHEEKYGYQLISELRDRSNGALALKEGTLYPILYRLEDGGLVTSRMSAHVAKEPARKYYAITEAGRVARDVRDLERIRRTCAVDHGGGAMNKESYVKAVAKRLTCSKARQAEFVRDLESDIAAALSAGETWEQVESRMGDPRQVAQEFNEDLSEAERAAGKKRKRTKTIAIVATVAVAVAAIIGAATWWASPKTAPAGQSSHQTEQQVIERAQEVVALLDAGDYETLQSMSIDEMKAGLNAEMMEQAREITVPGDWGAFGSFGNAYATEISQSGQVFDVVEVVAVYEKATVTYGISFLNGEELAGIRMR